jgi:hypothetical protein
MLEARSSIAARRAWSSMSRPWFETPLVPVARLLHRNHMSLLGIRNTMRLAEAYNRARYRRQAAWRAALYADGLDELLTANGSAARSPLVMRDGWALDTSMSLPHLDRVLADSETIIAERAGERRKAGSYRSYFQDLFTPGDLATYPSFLDFATSSPLLAVVAAYMKCVPSLSATLPAGLRLVESNAAFDDQPDRPKDSQLYHIDYYSLPNVYVLVLLRDTTPEHGPWTFLPRAASQAAARKLGYWGRKRRYRLSDDEVYAVADRNEVIEFCHPRGTVLFIESSGCLHSGSRGSIKPRFQLMLGFTTACRTDFSEIFMTPRRYPVREDDPLVRRLVLDRTCHSWHTQDQMKKNANARIR